MKPQKRAYIELENRADASLTCKPCFFTHATTVPSLELGPQGLGLGFMIYGHWAQALGLVQCLGAMYIRV